MSTLLDGSVTNLRQALALSASLAELLADEPHAEVGAAVDELVGFFRTWHSSALFGNADDVEAVFDNLGPERATAAATWLGRRAEDWDTFLYWQRIIAHCQQRTPSA
jgi:hypothetical protein